MVEKQRRDDVLFMQLSRRVDALQTQLAEAQREAEEDPLTGAANRRGFDRALREWTATASRTKKAFLLRSSTSRQAEWRASRSPAAPA